MRDEWVTRAACAGTSPDVFFPPADRTGWSPAPARAICDGCPVKVECLTAAVDRREPSGIWGGAGTALLRDMRRHRHDATHAYTADCGCLWCAAVTRHFAWLARKVAGDATLVHRESNGPRITHGHRSSYARGCRCARCYVAGRSMRGLLRLCGLDVPSWWDATLGPGHGYDRFTAADDVAAARAAFAAQLGPVLAAARRAAGLDLQATREALGALRVHATVDRLAMVESGAGDGGLNPGELAALAVVYGIDLAAAFGATEAAA